MDNKYIRNFRNARAVIIGNPASLFPKELASYWRSFGLDVVIVTRNWGRGKELSDGTQILPSAEYETPVLSKAIEETRKLLVQIEHQLLKLEPDRYITALGEKTLDPYRPSFVDPIINSISIPNLVNLLKPCFVFGQEAFYYGLATALCDKCPRILMPWGGDVYYFAMTSDISFEMVKYALETADMVCPTSTVAAAYISENYEINKEKIHSISWGIKRDLFFRANKKDRKKICEKYGINPLATIFMNVRRFKPSWGSDIAIEAFSRCAKDSNIFHFILLGGAGSEEFIKKAEKDITNKGLKSQFTFFENDIPKSDCAELMSISDIFVSFMRTTDMRSFSILEATSAGGVPVLSDQNEYKEMEKLGFKALFVDINNIDSITRTLRSLASDIQYRKKIVKENRKYIRKYEDRDKQMSKMLDLIFKIVNTYTPPHVEKEINNLSSFEVIDRILEFAKKRKKPIFTGTGRSSNWRKKIHNET